MFTGILGSREEKFHFLEETRFEEINWEDVDAIEPFYFFKPKDLSQASSYNEGVQLSDLFPNYLGGVKTHNDSELVSYERFDTGFDQLYEYRPFDTRHINYDISKVKRNRVQIMKNFIGKENYGLVMDRQVVIDNWSHIQIVRNIIDNRLHYSRRGIPVVCPMFIYNDDGTASPNISNKTLLIFSRNLDESFTENLSENENEFDMLDLFDYCYGILNSNLYREKYKELLSMDFPRVPCPINSDMFWEIVHLGTKLRRLHLMDEKVPNYMNIALEGNGDNVITKSRFSDNKVYINQNQFFSNVTEEAWDFCFGGYHGLQKWFKDRHGRKLLEEDIEHVIQVYNIFTVSIQIMQELDDVLLKYDSI